MVAADGQPVGGFGANGVLVDAGFSSGKQVKPQKVVQMPDGGFLVSGFLQAPGQQTAQQFLARYSSTGQRDPTFGSGGVSFPSGVVRDIVPLPDGRAALATISPAGNLAVLEANGSMTAMSTSLAPGQLVRRPDGAVYALGSSAQGSTVAVLMKPDGSIDATFDSDVTSVLPTGAHLGATAVAYSPPNGTVLSDGRLVVAFAYSTALPAQVSCGLVALQDGGRYDPTFGDFGLISFPQSVCRVGHLADDTIVMTGDFGDPVLEISPNGTPLGTAHPPFDLFDLEANGTGGFYTRAGVHQLTAYDRFGNLDPTFGAGGTATVPGMTIAGFALLDSGDLITWGTPDSTPTALALGLLDGSIGRAPRPPVRASAKFVALPPQRILDTRIGLGAPAGALGVGGHLDVQIAGVAGVPDAAIAAVVLNITATEAAQAGYVSVYPSGALRPTVSSLNLETAQTAANLVTVKVGANGMVTVFSSGGTQLVADIAGYYTPSATSTDGRLQTAVPQRILDTRAGLGAPLAKLAAGEQIDLRVLGRGPVPATGVSAVVLNITGDQASADGFVTVWPTGGQRPLVSNLNLVAGDTRANLVVVPIGRDGLVSLFTLGGADLIADVAGWFTDSTQPTDDAGLFVPINPTRMLDTRNEPAAPTAPGSSSTRLIGSTTVVPPGSAMAVVADLTVTESGGAGFVTAWPAFTDRPLVSNLNTVRDGQTVPNAAVVPLGLDTLAVYLQSGGHLIIDVAGWYIR
jgi:hypothetical protein